MSGGSCATARPSSASRAAANPVKTSQVATQRSSINKNGRLNKNYRHLMTEQAFQDADDATSWAGVGNKFGGGTACGSDAPFPGQALRATSQTMARRAAAASAAPGSERDSASNQWGASKW